MENSKTRLQKMKLTTLTFVIHLSCLCLPLQLDIESEVNNEMANRMSLFYAEATPMLKTLSNATTNFVTEVRKPPCCHRGNIVVQSCHTVTL